MVRCLLALKHTEFSDQNFISDCFPKILYDEKKDHANSR